ncbi:protein-glutamine gamma-glutamyltransferase [Brevibacillus ruminantium]|uniref:Protein-glutamine gamma-glutamyltransferase n=1 Tax=Brevibacillus ruminantium TaxID=2950604 RepID=A0ABY4WCI0_9BACL|nr:protein-glutamine gamma-glutamyltransferase [Brevibacillus ruminantium]USG64895.1 protein-glutamine gamma-glutamyltransferase [Brevibacillus ruminantium]
MIRIAGMPADPASLASQWQLNGVQREIVERMARSEEVFAYPNPDLLSYELRLRNQIVISAQQLHRSGLAFANFDETRCNGRYWMRTDFGGCQQRPDVPSSTAIENIFLNGRAYAFECATAMVIILYHAVLQTNGNSSFDQLFQGLLLYDWRYDQNLRLTTAPTSTFLPGDILYFDNPDYRLDQPEWQGENAVFLGNGLYYGHGIGINSAEGMIRSLNGKRRPGATRSAYLLDQATRPGFDYLARFEGTPTMRLADAGEASAEGKIRAEIGSLVWER